MSSESGLVKRKVAASVLNESRNNSNNTNDLDNNENNELNEEGNDEYDADSKETRLTLMEEILLLGLKDREVTIKICSFKQSNQFDIICLNKGLYIVLERLYF